MNSLSLEELRELAARLFAGTPVFAAYVYGSRVWGKPGPKSDLDVGYYLRGYAFGESLPLRDEMVLAARWHEALGVLVDLRNLGEAPLELRGRVLEDGARIYSSDEPARVALERDLLARYHDYKETFRRLHELRLKTVATKDL
jgi:predicted nucleotidyltransferase